MKSPMNECITQQGNLIPQVTLQRSSQTQNQEIQQNEQDTVSRSSSNNKDRKESRRSHWSEKKPYWKTAFYDTYQSTSEELKSDFKDLPKDERLIAGFLGVLQGEMFVPGRIYVTEHYLCFYPLTFTFLEKALCFKWDDVTAMFMGERTISKGISTIVGNNSATIETGSQLYCFATAHAERDRLYSIFVAAFSNRVTKMLSIQEIWQKVYESLDQSDNSSESHVNATGNKIYPIERLSADTLSEQQVFGGGGTDKGGSELGSSATDSTNKSQGSVPSHNAYLGDSTPSPLQMKVDGMPSDLSHNSSESDVNATGKKVATSCSSPHEGRHIISTILPIQVDKLFTLMFTNSKFFFDFHTMRQSSDINASSWQQSRDSNEKIRTISMVISLGQALGPKSANVQQTQIMLPCSVSGHLYSIDDEIVNSGIPYADSFYILMHYCLEKVSDNETSLNIYGQLKYKKSVWSFVKNLIEKTMWNNMKDHNDSLVKALLAECEETMTIERKSRRRHHAVSSTPVLIPVDHLPSSTQGPNFSKVTRTITKERRSRHRAISSKPVLLPVDHLPSSTRRPNFSKVTRTVETDRRTNILLGLVLVLLVFLLFLNIFLHCKLWLLEDFTQVSKFNF